MTTNAIDRNKMIVTSDGRWSIPLPNELHPTHVLYVDDTGFEKITSSEIATLVFAGDSVLISEWKTWFNSERRDLNAIPPTERDTGRGLADINICIITPAGRVLFDRGLCLTHGENARFAGSGAIFARDCFGKNGCSIRAIDTAGLSDPYTGGTTKYVELHSGISNLTTVEATLQEAEQQLNERGLLMELATGRITPFKDAQDSKDDAMQALKNGANLSAPTGQPSRKWTDDEKLSLRAAIEEVMGSKPL